MFADRLDAGRQLLARMPVLEPKESLVMALPRGGVPVAEVIAEALDLALDVVFVRKVGLPDEPELAVAAVTNGARPVFAINHAVADMAGLDEAAIRELAAPELAEIARRRAAWDTGRMIHAIAGKTVVVVDDGIATGATMRAALLWLRQEGAARLILAVPVAADGALADLAPLVDEVICLRPLAPHHAVGAHYRDFRQVTDDEVIAALERLSGRSDTE